MSVAEKLTTVAENVDKVFNAGHLLGKDEGIAEGYENGYVDGSEPFDKLISGELSAVVNDRVTVVGSRCFFANPDIRSADFPNVTIVHRGAFLRCRNLTSVNMPLLNYMELDTEEGMGPFARSGLVEVDFPNVDTLCNHAFNSCSSLKSVNLPKITDVPVNAFAFCSALTDFDFSKIVSIGNSAFNYAGLASVESETVTQIDNSAFSYSTSLKTVYLPNVTTSGTSAFNGCAELESLVMPNLETIPNSFCNSATKLTRFDAHVATSIGSYAFYRSGLQTLILRSPTVCALSNSNAFSNTTCNIYVPDDLVSTYKAATNWTSVKTRIFPISDLEE